MAVPIAEAVAAAPRTTAQGRPDHDGRRRADPRDIGDRDQLVRERSVVAQDARPRDRFEEDAMTHRNRDGTVAGEHDPDRDER